MKKNLSLVLAVTMVASLAGCGQKEEVSPEPSTNITEVVESLENTSEVKPEVELELEVEPEPEPEPLGIVYDTTIQPKLLSNNGDIVFTTIGTEEEIPEFEWNSGAYENDRFLDFFNQSNGKLPSEFSDNFLILFGEKELNSKICPMVPYTKNIPEDVPGGEFSITADDGTIYLKKNNFYDESGSVVAAEVVWGGIADTSEQTLRIASLAPARINPLDVEAFAEYCRNYFKTVGTYYTNSITRDFVIRSKTNEKAENSYFQARCYINEENYFCLELIFNSNNSKFTDVANYNEHNLLHIMDSNVVNPFGFTGRFSSMEELVKNEKFLDGEFGEYERTQVYTVEYPSKYEFVATYNKKEDNASWRDIRGVWTPNENDIGGVMTLTMEGHIGPPQIHFGSAQYLSRMNYGASFAGRFEDMLDYMEDVYRETGEKLSIKSHSETTGVYGSSTIDMEFYVVEDENNSSEINFTIVLKTNFGGELETPVNTNN